MKHEFVESPETQVPLVIYPGATLSARDGVYVRNLKVNQFCFCFLFSVCSGYIWASLFTKRCGS